MTFCENPLSRSLLGIKRTSLFAAHMCAYDPKRTSPFIGAKGLSTALANPYGGTYAK
jgi:hypothetical protein